MRAALLLLALSSGLLLPSASRAQRLQPGIGANGSAPGVQPDAGVPHRSDGRRLTGWPSQPDSDWWMPAASLILPGAGQALLRQNRFIVYLAVEGYGLLEYFDQHAEAVREQERYRSLARDVARVIFPGNRPVGPWAYYESMEHFVESGVFDRLPGGDLAPESDQTTHNGALWLLARQTFWRSADIEPDHNSAEYRRSIAMYLERAIRPEYRWSWRNAQLEQDLYRRSIAHSNEAYRDARAQVALLIANRLLSTVDAFVTLRLRRGVAATRSPGSVSASIPWAPLGRPNRP